ncbi:MAG: 50S ribosomal protein L23 [Candidatus Abyssobacteria bacterium SURF_17]|jgi:large subunit ribosomal protein L23|uniref:Large ribosomal subunit protein uL23 n=1 Tax=Candidatus Abyssobacteria bacterium SURF_17 TaxID=2093361 RepID=A0A419EVM5_9BACT|nr:MAG: 50S ribosomal protein L23 [Candidatus Abyssubacteria bacterium SURF_17]
MKYDPYVIIRRPVVSEKATLLSEKQNKYVFEVAPNANKIQVKKAVEDLFKVSVTKVRTMRVPGKQKRVRLQVGRTPEWKKAIVTLKEGDRIELF